MGIGLVSPIPRTRGLEDTYVSCTHNAAVMDWRDYYKYNGNDDVKYCVDVVAYYPLP